MIYHWFVTDDLLNYEPLNT